MAVTLKDIASQVGVNPATVSLALNNKRSGIRISEKTRQEIQRVARELGYQPNTAARALRTQRTGQLGFLLSEAVLGGWANAYYAQFLEGVEKTCREAGYGLQVNRYNLTNVDKFVYPAKVQGRAVDGLILSGRVDVAVVKRFKEFGIPCVSIGANTELPNLLPTISSDVVADLKQGIEYTYGLGHRRIGLCVGKSRDAQNIVRGIRQAVAEDPALEGCQVTHFDPPSGLVAPLEGESVFEHWQALPASERPTVFMAGNQMVVGFLKAMHRQGLRCPEDVSLISGGDTALCRLVWPELTALSGDLPSVGASAVRMLVEHLDQGKPLESVSSDQVRQGRLILRGSCAPPRLPSHP